jgi:2Fe-2S iron-sulfur cluster binding domain
MALRPRSSHPQCPDDLRHRLSCTESRNELQTRRIACAKITPQLLEQEKAMAASKTLSVNGKSVSIGVDDPDMPLLYALRDDLGLHGPRFGCGLGQCGACTVHIDGAATRSCITPLSSLTADNKVVTLEGLALVVGFALFPSKARTARTPASGKPVAVTEVDSFIPVTENAYCMKLHRSPHAHSNSPAGMFKTPELCTA